jgi:hypothetical protein
MEKYNRAKAKRERFVPLFEECYEYTLPQRESFYYEEHGQRRDDRIFDETAVVGVQEFASRLQSGIVPNYARWAQFSAGSEVPPEDRDRINNELDEITQYVFDILQNSNFSQSIHECFLDLAVGTAVLLVEEGDSLNPLNFVSIPLPRIVLDIGPDEAVDHIFRERRGIRFDMLGQLYPAQKFDQKVLGRMNGNDTTDVLEIVCRDYSAKNQTAFLYYAICQTTKTVLHYKKLTGIGSNPFIAFRWSTSNNEIYGRGPVFNSLSAIKTVNLVMQLVLENAQMQVSGIYQMEDDGVINVDTINLVPGTIIPKAMGSAGLQPINAAGRLEFSQFVYEKHRMDIKKNLFMDMLADPNKTPATATEVAERMADLSRRMGAAVSRLQSEMVQPVLQRVIYILKKQGRIELPTVNGREIKIRSISPLAQAQSNEDIVGISRYLETIGNFFGPDMLRVLIDPEKTAIHLAELFNVPDTLIRDEDQRRQISEAAQQLMEQQMMMQQAQAQQMGEQSNGPPAQG